MRGGPGLYRTIWRWHFYAGLFVIPFVLILSATGALYLFKPQIERWEERGFRTAAGAPAVAPHRQLEAALAAHPGATFLDYRLPDRSGDAAMIRLAVPQAGVRQVFVSPGGKVVGALDPGTRIMAVTKRIHSEVLIGPLGNRLVELAACWAIVMILSGLYLWWPRTGGLAGVVWPRLGRGGRALWRDVHAVAGFWVAGLALVLLVSGLPWAGVWGPAFGAVRAQLGWVHGPAQWAIDSSAPPPPAGSGHDHGHHGASPAPSPDAPFSARVFDQMVTDARNERLAFPAIVTPPGGPQRFEAPGLMLWTIRSDVQNPPLRTTIRYDLTGRSEIAREQMEDSHPIDRVINYGIAWHEGQLFGWLNQLIGLVTALLLMAVAASGFVMWRKRKPQGQLGAPPAGARVPGGLLAILVVLALVLPLLALSLLVIFAIERLVLVRIAPARRWLGL